MTAQVLAPMLAEPSKSWAPSPEGALRRLLTHGDWMFDVKWDGVRCMAYLIDGQCVLMNRNGVDITLRYPDVVAMLLEAFGDRSAILDGEVIALGKDGKPDFNLLATRDRQTTSTGVQRVMSTTPVVFVIFDVPLLDGDNLIATGYGARYAVLQHERDTHTWSTHLWLSPCSTDGEAMWHTIQAQGLEGLIAKRIGSPYREGRSPDWVKIKVTHTVTCYVRRYEEGKGSRAGKVGALILELLDGSGNWVEVGKAGTGLTMQQADTFALLLDTGRPKDFLVVEVEYANVTKDGRLRFPSFKGIRSDKRPEDCTLDQLDKEA